MTLGLTLDPAAVTPQHAQPLVVAHVGLMGEQPGGMAQVVNEYLTWGTPGTQRGILSSRRKRDWAAPLLVLSAAARLIGLGVERAVSKRPTVVVFHISEGGSFVREGGLLIGARLLGLRTIAHIHGASFEEFAAAHPTLVRTILSHANAVAVLTDRTEATVRDVASGAELVKVVRNVVAVPGEQCAKERTVLFGGQLSERKGIDTLLLAWADVTDRFPHWRLVLAGPTGPGYHLPSVLPPRVTAIGSVTHNAMLEQLSTAAIAVLPSRQEALPMFLLEALAHQCATIGSTAGQVPALLADGVGVLVEPADPAGLSAALASLIEDDAERQQVAARGYAHVSTHYSHAAARAELEEFWRRAATD